MCSSRARDARQSYPGVTPPARRELPSNQVDMGTELARSGSQAKCGQGPRESRKSVDDALPHELPSLFG